VYRGAAAVGIQLDRSAGNRGAAGGGAAAGTGVGVLPWLCLANADGSESSLAASLAVDHGQQMTVDGALLARRMCLTQQPWRAQLCFAASHTEW
jgi:hypothetical protein